MSTRILFFLTALFFIACSDDKSSSSSDEPHETEFTSKDFVLVHATDSSSFVGTNDSTAKNSERPKMTVKFSYDFYIGKNEVTCGEFIPTMKKEFGDETPDIECENDSLPITDITYYDVILYANARSKAEHFDTVYTYSAKTTDGKNHCTYLDGFAFNTQKRGYRLPTEAEWTFAAKKGWSTQNSWNADNSDYKLHKVCTKPANDIGLCDMTGNAMEWVYDWLGYFKDTTITDFMGSPYGENLAARIVKGGSYHNNPNAISLHSRGDVYVVTSSTHANYVGFRLAFGKIPNPSWLSNNGGTINTNIKAEAKSSDIRKLTDTYRVKLAFRDDITGNLEYLDYSSGVLSFHEIQDVIPIYHPEISPNGNYVAFCTAPEGIPGESAIYVRTLSPKGSGLEKLNVESASIPRWRVLENGDTVIVYVSSAKNNKDAESFKETSTWQVRFTHGRFGTPKKLLDGAYHGGISEDGTLAVTGASLLRAKLATEGNIYGTSATDSIWYGGQQACNVSLAKDGTKRTLFLDFGGSIGKEFVGESYNTHERILIADSTGKLIHSIAAPEKYSFDHSEWVSENLIIATLTDVNGVHGKIVLINLEDDSITELVNGDELWHPTLWIGNKPMPKTNLDMDSAGVYLNPNDDWGATLMRNNMELLWKYADSTNVAIVGSSRPLYSLNPSKLSKKFFAINFGHVPNSIYASRDYLNHYLFTHLKKMKYLVISLDIDFWFKTDGPKSDNFFVVNAPKYPGYAYDANHNYWKDSIPTGLLEATERGYTIEEDGTYTKDHRGRTKVICRSWGGKAVVETDTNNYQQDLIDSSMSALKSIIETAGKKDIHVIGILFPQSPHYKKTGAFGRYGLKRSKAKEIINDLRDLSDKYSNFTFMDENKMGDHDYVDYMATDYDHLCSTGGELITKRLDSLLLKLD